MKILVIRLSSIGDIVLVTPVIRWLYVQLNAEVHLMTKQKYRDVLSSNSYLTSIINYEDRDNIDMASFDIVIDLQKNLRSWMAARLRCNKYLTFKKANVTKWLMTTFRRDLSVPHIVTRYADALVSLGISDDGKGLDFDIGDHIYGGKLPSIFYCINLGGTYHTKRIPTAVIAKIMEKIALPCVLLGGADVLDIANQIIGHQVINLVGKTSLYDSAYIIGRCQGLITSDSAIMHIGAALRVRMYVMWGNTTPKFGMYPWTDELGVTTNLEVEGLPCRPCHKLGKGTCPKGHFNCMMMQNVDNIKL